IGAAWVMGIKLMRNFDRPYHSASIREFWSRWHISLSTWFRDYLYIPLGGNRVPKWRWSLNLLIVFMVSGLWHGANWTFVVWGALHGFFLVFAIWTGGARERLAAAIGLNRVPALKHGLAVAGTFLLVSFAWIFFRAQSLADAWYIVTHLHVGLIEQFSSAGRLADTLYAAQMMPSTLALALAGVAVMEAIHLAQARGVGVREALLRRPIWLRWAAYQAAILVVILFGVYENQAFIYFQF
ncbi:MAG: MBOAT family O-acyltransferase, partial [Candidatus Sericytochromatia bacterium]